MKFIKMFKISLELKIERENFCTEDRKFEFNTHKKRRISVLDFALYT